VDGDGLLAARTVAAGAAVELVVGRRLADAGEDAADLLLRRDGAFLRVGLEPARDVQVGQLIGAAWVAPKSVERVR
jgi:hypothetical protein